MELISEIMKHSDELLAGALALIVALNALVAALRGLVKIANVIAAKTASKEDDRVLAAVTKALDGFADGLHWLERKIPRAQMRMGSKLPSAADRRASTTPPAPAPPPPPRKVQVRPPEIPDAFKRKNTRKPDA